MNLPPNQFQSGPTPEEIERRRKLTAITRPVALILLAFLGCVFFIIHLASKNEVITAASTSTQSNNDSSPSSSTESVQLQSWQTRYDTADDNKAKADLLYEIATRHIILTPEQDVKFNKLEDKQKKARAFLVNWLTQASLEMRQMGNMLDRNIDVSYYRLHNGLGLVEPGLFDRLTSKEKAAKMLTAAKESQEDIQILKSLTIK